MKKQAFLLSLFALIVMASCSSSKDYVYLQDMYVGERYPIEQKHEAVVHCDDRLSIVVSCKSPELAIPFNIQGGSYEVSADGRINTAGVTKEKGYRVDAEGFIDFPILGKIEVAGKKVSEVKNIIQNKIISGSYIKDPIVAIEFLNFKYTVLGAAGSGTYSVDGDRITLLEAIAKAGDLADNAKIDRVLVIREELGERRVYEHDLRNKSVFESPAFYLQQNDIVYVEPKYKKKDKEDKTLQYTSLLLSIATAACSIIYCVK